MIMSGPSTIFDLAQGAMSSQLVRMNTAASNLANAGSIAGSAEEAYRPLRPVFQEELGRASGMSGVRVDQVIREDIAAVRSHQPGHALADENGDVWLAPIDENAEMVEMLEASRQYRNMVEALSTAKQLMLETVRMK